MWYAAPQTAEVCEETSRSRCCFKVSTCLKMKGAALSDGPGMFPITGRKGQNAIHLRRCREESQKESGQRKGNCLGLTGSDRVSQNERSITVTTRPGDSGVPR